MKTKLNKILTVITAVTFAAALTLNIQASLNDPFAGMSDEALAQTTSEGETTGCGCDNRICNNDLNEICVWWCCDMVTVDFMMIGDFVEI